MINVFKLKKIAAFILTGFIPTMIFYAVTVSTNNVLWGLVGIIPAMLLSIGIATFLVKNPFTDMIEGKGVLAVNLDSTGILDFFILKIRPPYMNGRFRGVDIKDVFDRNAVFNITPAQENVGDFISNDDGSIDIHMNKEEFNKGKFASMHYPLIIWNDQLKTIITKDWLSTMENSSFAEHHLLFLNREVERLNNALRDFGRYVVETTKPIKKWFEGKGGPIIIIVVIVIIVGILLAIFGPQIVSYIKQSNVAETVNVVKEAASTITAT